jgi:fucose 4-O-acetylase-like acetyltransferase
MGVDRVDLPPVLGRVVTATRQRAGVHRLAVLDALRGVAILLMGADHLLLLAGAPVWTRLGPTRLAMPLFMLLAGAVFTRWRARHVLVYVAGVALPFVAPWVGSPDILVQYAVAAAGLAVIVGLARRNGHDGRANVCVVVVAALVVAANGWARSRGAYDTFSVCALVFLGYLIGAPRLAAWAALVPCPRWLRWLGRHSLVVYVGHVLVLSVVFA